MTSFPWHYKISGTRGKSRLLLLHGFAGSLGTWNFLLPLLEPHAEIIRLDLPGHGGTPVPQDRMSNLAELGSEIAQWMQELDVVPSVIFGYSLGGRVALHVALAAAQNVRALIFLGASLGMADEIERQARVNSDNHLAANIHAQGIEWFVDYWENLPIFASQKKLPEKIRQAICRARLACDPEGLAFALEHYGTGQQNFLLPRFSEFPFPILCLAGEWDRKFCASNREIENASIAHNVRRVEIPNAGHAAHIENPTAVARELLSFIQLL